MAELLLANQADVNATNNHGATPLHAAVILNRPEVAEVLLAHGADVTAKDDQGLTPLDQATQRGRTNLVELLRQTDGK